jgi:hypothetical protein
MARLAQDVAIPATTGSHPDVAQAGDLAERMRSTVTPVIGYLELISQETDAMPTDRHLHWISTIERRLEAMREVSDQISRVCEVLRDSVNDREAASPPGPEAPAD